MFPLIFFLCSFLSLFLLPPSNIAAVSNHNKYLKLPLLRKSPFPSPTQALALDTRRLHFLSLRRKPIPFVKSPVVSGAASGSGQYFVDLRIGQPPQSLLLIADTGSDLVWVKCSACRNCSHHSPATVFFPRHSSTFSPAHCYDPVCRLVPKPDRAPICNHTRIHSTCHYEYGYADGSLTSGLFARETTSLKTSSGKEARLKSVAFGCGFRISGQSVSGNGGTVVDSGTTLAFLAEPAYRSVIAAVRRRVKLPIADALTPGFDLCVNVSGVTKPEKILPRLKFEFSGGAVFVPPPRNYFIETEEQIQCLAIQSVDPKVGFSVIGNLMQQGFLFEFDRDRSRLGFSRRGCALP
ncbi:Eukaryotic aspartyl protease family protein [Arabidopsis thaliana]|uniref:Eukaryotic aspartyl protease family protein n=1 Tax=Arabidopsis thaliana TaxID=3702 RepID=F4JA44_ARATH|nr:Eukaryotic aspartyl protease family protein [Arabidopsis thaliana]AEE77055.1 Eukaryotic aspartyl protease family protein [Arabidopsis thaliana]|eukprot:NP_001154646.1 Eukaryotic aspartyl protease family protein [Arabidopsis thaliana]